MGCLGGSGRPEAWGSEVELRTGKGRMEAVSLLWDEPAERVGDLSNSSGRQWVIW